MEDHGWAPLPTLFIALGGTGQEIATRLLSRIERLEKRPDVGFISFDLDAYGPSVWIAEEDRIPPPTGVLLEKYFRSDGDVNPREPLPPWMPSLLGYEPGLNMNLSMTRCIPRLHFYEQYPLIRDLLSNKIDHLLSNAYGLEMPAIASSRKTLRIVVVCSSVGGTGSGTFLDMGFLAKLLGEETGVKVSVELFMLLPSGYSVYSKELIEGNGYAALMELETLMSQDVKFVERWDPSEPVRQPRRPYDEVYLFDTTNFVGECAANVVEIYDMVAESLFEDLQSEAINIFKRKMAPCKAQHKLGGFTPPFSGEFRELKLTYSNAYSSLGQFTIDTHFEQNRNMVVAKRVNTMLESFFGIGAHRVEDNKPTEIERDALMNEHIYLAPQMYTLKYKYAGKPAPGFEEDTEKSSWMIVDAVLRDQGGRSLVDDVTAKIHNDVEQIKRAGDRDQWPLQIAALKRQLERDAFKNVASGTGMREDGIIQQRAQVLARLVASDSSLVKALWDRVDNNERGGINYTRELIESVKDRIENAETGILTKLLERAKWFDDLSGKINADEIRELETNLGQTCGSGLFSIGRSRQQRAETVLGQLGEALSLWIVSHLRAVACREAHALLVQLSAWLGEKTGYNAKTDEEYWSGFIGQLIDGRKQVEQVMALMDQEIAATKVSMKTEHASYVVISAPQNVLNRMAQETDIRDAKTWAQETFQKYGGKRDLFVRLATKTGRAELIAELRNMALRKLPNDILQPRENPLFEALRNASDREALFRHCLRRSMPWVNANLSGIFVADATQYTCAIGVGNAMELSANSVPNS